MTSLAPMMTEDPKATSKHTLCGYGWGDVQTALIRAIGTADMTRAQRWGAELVCSELGLGRLEAVLFHGWALHVGSAHPGWGRQWYNSMQQLRAMWQRSGGDTKAIRNTPTVRQFVGEAIASLVLAAKKPLPALPTAADCFREAEGMRARLRAGGGVGDQPTTRRVWDRAADGNDLRTIGNELEAALRTAQTSRLLFWITWFFTLDVQTDAPTAKERGPAQLTVKARKSLLWFLVALLKGIADESAFLSVDERAGLFGTLETTWAKLGVKGRRDVVAAIALALHDHLLHKGGAMGLTAPKSGPALGDVRASITMLDKLYSNIGEEARRFMLEAPKLVGLTSVAEPVAKPRLSSQDKLSLVFSLSR